MKAVTSLLKIWRLVASLYFPRIHTLNAVKQLVQGKFLRVLPSSLTATGETDCVAEIISSSFLLFSLWMFAQQYGTACCKL